MPLDKASMAAKVKAKMAAVQAQQVDSEGDATAYRDQILEALCDGIIEEITSNAQVPVSGGSSAGTYPVT